MGVSKASDYIPGLGKQFKITPQEMDMEALRDIIGAPEGPIVVPSNPDLEGEGLGFFNVKDYGAIGDGVSRPLSTKFSSLTAAKAVYPKATALTDELDSAAIQKAFDAASAQSFGPTVGGTVYIPAGRYRCNVPLYSLNISVIGDVQATVLVWPELGDGVAAITVDRDNGKRAVWSHIFLVGPGTFNPTNPGIKNAYGTGIKLLRTAMPMFDNVAIRHFGKGMDWANDGGHIKLSHVHIEYNWYGVYVSHNSGDYSVIHSSINQNVFANFATHAGSGIEGLSVRDSHCGYAPYSFYCEPAPNPAGGANIFLKDVRLDHCRFEQVGNGAVFSDPSQGAKPRVEGLRIIEPGFSWGRDKGGWVELSNWPRDYAIDLGTVINGEILIENDSYPFTAGDVGVIRVREQVHPATITIIGTGSKSTDVVVDMGTRRVTVGTNPSVQQVGIEDNTARRLSRLDRPGDLFEEDITTDNTGVQWRLSRIVNGVRTEIFNVGNNFELRFRQALNLDKYLYYVRATAPLANPKEGTVYIDTSNSGYECVRTYLGARWTRRGVGLTMPTAGTWQRGDYIENSAVTETGTASSKYVVMGWIRLTSSSNNVLNTDWVEDRRITGN